ncbi:MAG: sigma-70 family RNA polymerase sigma factor [Ginsengibacter sp.]
MSNQSEHDELLGKIKDNKGIIYKIVNSYCSNKNERDDLAQEILYQLFRSYTGYKSELKFTTWMYRVALNVAISFYRKTKSRSIETFVEQHKDLEDNNEQANQLENNISLLQQFINELKELDKALMLLYLESRPYKEIAEILGITETNVATKISRVKEKLKQKFSKINQ